MINYPEPWTAASLPMPRDQTNNFWYVHNSSQVVFVFVHGIFSDSRSCWLFEDTASNRLIFWPDLVRNDGRLSSPSIYLAGFYTSLGSGDFAIPECAREILNALAMQGLDGNQPVLEHHTIIFVCHSTGGIVVRYLLERYRDLFHEKCVGLLLIASPSTGSRWASIFSLAAHYYNQRLGLQLRPNSELLEEIDRRFRDLVDQRDTAMPLLYGMEACEHKMVFRNAIFRWIRWLMPSRLRVVAKQSAGRYFGEVTVLPGTDHFTTVKPDSFSHSAHLFLVKFYSDFCKRMKVLGHDIAAQNGEKTKADDRLEQQISLLRRNLIAATSFDQLTKCQVEIKGLSSKYPYNTDLILLADQAERAIKVEEAKRTKSRNLLLLQSGTTGVLLLMIAFTIVVGPQQTLEIIRETSNRVLGSIHGHEDIVITSLSKVKSESADSPALITGRVARAYLGQNVYVLYRERPSIWVAQRARVYNDNSWEANLGMWGTITSAGTNTAEIMAVVSRSDLESLRDTGRQQPALRISDDLLAQNIVAKSLTFQVDVQPQLLRTQISIVSPQDGKQVSADSRMLVNGIGIGLQPRECIYVLHRIDENNWIGHPAIVGEKGAWEAELGAWAGHQTPTPPIFTITALALKDCPLYQDILISNEAMEQRFPNHPSPINVKVNGYVKLPDK